MYLNLAAMAKELAMSEEQLREELGIMSPVQSEAFASLKARALAATPHSHERRYLFGLLAKYFLENADMAEGKGAADRAEDDLFSFANQKAA